MKTITKAEVYVDGSYNKHIPDITRGGVAVIFDDVPYAFIKLKTERPMYVKQWNVGGELMAATMGLNMILNELEKLKSLGVIVPDYITLTHDYMGIHDLVLPSAKTGKVWNSDKEGCIFYKEFYKKLKEKYPTQINFQWVKSHRDNKWNNVVDQLAKGFWPFGSYDDVIKQEVNF